MKYDGWINFNHLRDAEQINGDKKSNIAVLYFKHMSIGLREAFTQLLLCLASIVHAFFPFIFNFKLLEIVVKQARGLHNFLPTHPVWKDFKKELNNEQE